MRDRYQVEGFMESLLSNPNVNVRSENPTVIVNLALRYSDAFDAAFPRTALVMEDPKEPAAPPPATPESVPAVEPAPPTYEPVEPETPIPPPAQPEKPQSEPAPMANELVAA